MASNKVARAAKPNLIDRIINVVSPEAGVRRMRARIAAAYLSPTLARLEKRGYQGASRSNRTSGWSTGGGSADSEIAPALKTLRDRHRDLVRNNPYAERAVRAIVANTIGTGIVAQAMHENDNVRATINAAWKSWSETRDCDSEGRHNLAGLQQLALRTIVDSGEVLIRRHIRRRGNLRIPLQIQILEPDYLDTTRDQALDNGGKIVQGVEYDASGKVVAYYLYPEHPGGIVYGVSRLESQRIPASEILHIFRRDRAGQTRGTPWGTPITMRLHDLDEMEEAQLLRQKVAACFAAFIQTPDGVNDPSSEEEAERLGRLRPGSLEYLQPGETVTFGAPPGAEGYSDYTRTMIRSVAIAYGVTYETLSGDFSQVNFSSARMGWLEFQRNVEDWRWNLIIPGMCDPIWKWWMEVAELVGVIPEYADPFWTAPRREMIDPVKETDALRAQVLAGFKSLSEAILESGYDPRETLEQLARDKDFAEKLGLSLTSFNSRANVSRETKSQIENEDKDDVT